MFAPCHRKPTRHFLSNVLFVCAEAFCLTGCNDVSTAPPRPAPVPPAGPTVLTITTESPISGAVNTPFNVTLTAVSGNPPYVWTIVGNQPPGPGLTLNSAKGVISGTPTSASSTTRTYLVIDSTVPTAQTAEKSLTIEITTLPDAVSPPIASSSSPTGGPEPMAITPLILPHGTVNAAYPTIQLEVHGGVPPYAWSVFPPLPNGLSLNLLGPGIISGIPLHASVGQATHTFRVIDSSIPAGLLGELTRDLIVNAILMIDTGSPTGPSLPAGTVGKAYDAALSASGGTGPGTYGWSIVGNLLPAPGLLPLSDSGVIAGTPSTPGSFVRSYRVRDGNGTTATIALTLTVNEKLAIDNDDRTLPLPSGIVGQPYKAELSASGGTGPGTYLWSVTTGSPALPIGLTVNVNGTIAGTPAAVGAHSLTFSVADAASAAVEKRLSIAIAAR